MKKVFEFLESLTPAFLELLGYPTVRFSSDFIEVYFDTSNTFRSLECLVLLDRACDEFSMFAGHNVVYDREQITIVCKFYNLPFEE